METVHYLEGADLPSLDTVSVLVDEAWEDVLGCPLSHHSPDSLLCDAGAADRLNLEMVLVDVMGDLHLEWDGADQEHLTTVRSLVEYVFSRLVLKEYDDGRLHRLAETAALVLLRSPVPWIRDRALSVLPDVAEGSAHFVERASTIGRLS